MSNTIYTKTQYANVTIPTNGGGIGGSGVYTISIGGGGGGGSGAGLMSTSGSTWNNAATWATAQSELKPASIQVNGDAVFHGNITWQGRDMREWFAAVESRLAILQPNPKLEEDFDKLKDLGDQYRTLEKKLLEQQQIFDILKKS
jgi:hypothetical protein